MIGRKCPSKIISVTVMVTFLLLLFTNIATAAVSPSQIYYQVQAGDYLWLIGWKFETTTSSIMSLNNMKTADIYPGQTLRIPAPNGFVREVPKNFNYVVQQGDSLYIIGQKYGVSVDALRGANKIAGNSIMTGQVLIIPLPSQQRYTVKPGDTLYLLAKNFGTTTEVVRLVNKMNTSNLWIGQVLFVPQSTGTSGTLPPSGETQPPSGETQPPSGETQPPSEETQPSSGETQPSTEESVPPMAQIDYSKPLPGFGHWGTIPSGVILYHIQPGENLWVLAQRFHTTENAIKETNHLKDDLVQINQPVFIPQNTTQPAVIPYPAGTIKEGYGELMDWEYDSWIFGTHDTATLKDVATGKSFNIRRYGGSNHADSEPLTPADSAMMKEIFGGIWTWEARAVRVYVNGKVLAGSMSGMPHSFDSIPDNEFNGHFDLYFLNCRSHVDNAIEPNHQKMVLTAAGY